jgi:hypothetical protein
MSNGQPTSGAEDTSQYPDPGVLERRRYAAAVGIAMAVLLVVAASASYLLYRPAGANPRQMIEIVEKAIVSQIPAGSDLQFDAVQVAARDDGYEVTGFADAVVTGGETGRFRFSCLVRKREDGTWAPDRWEITRLR